MASFFLDLRNTDKEKEEEEGGGVFCDGNVKLRQGEESGRSCHLM